MIAISSDRYTPVVNDKNLKDLRKGTADYYEWWNTQIDRCVNGYKPHGGVFIPGRYYFYLNFCKILLFDEAKNRKTFGSPMYRDQDHEYMNEIDLAEKGGYGLIVLKSRRKGFSFAAANVLLHDWTFNPGSENGVGAQTEGYVNDFKFKLMLTYNMLPQELRNRWLINNAKLLKSGYKEKIDGDWVEKGFMSQLYFRIMEKPDAFRGTSLKFMVFEEAGEFLQLKRSYFANEECFREGAKQFGVPIIGGTSNQLSHDTTDFIDMYKNAEEYNLKPLFFPASKCYGVFQPYFDPKTGASNVEESTKDILERRAKLKAGNDKEKYYSFMQEMPLEPADAFLLIGASPFDAEKIQQQLAKIETNKYMRIVRRGTLEWKTNKEGKQVFGSKPDFHEDKAGWLEVIDDGHPLTHYKNAHVAAVDPYHVSDDLDEKKPGKKAVEQKDRSKGSMCIYRRYIDTNTMGELPVAFYTDRPYSKEEFYENCAKLAIYYDSQILIENNDDGFLKFFIDKKLTRYLKERPRSADSPYSQASNKYGLHMKDHQKRLVTELVDEYIKKHWEDIYFTNLLGELLKFGTANTDRVMSFGMALIHDMDNTRRVKPDGEEEETFSLPTFSKGLNGQIISVHTQSDKNWAGKGKRGKINYNFGTQNEFSPSKHTRSEEG